MLLLSIALLLPLVSCFSTFGRSKSSTFFAPRTVLHAAASSATLQIGDEVGSGSYGTVHLCSLEGSEDELICKRAWTKEDLEKRQSSTTADRCKHYFDVERHCFEKMDRQSQYVSKYVDTFSDASKNKWMTFQLLSTGTGTNKAVAPTLEDVLELDWEDQHEASKLAEHHHLYVIQDALGLPEDATFGDTLDTVLQSLLKAMTSVHSQNIVHRDMKPANLLCDASTQSLVLIDFGSAADMDPVKANLFTKKRIGLEDDSVAVSPIYAAPEIFIRPDRAPHAFDVYSSALIFCQLLFNLLDKRTDAAFHQQIDDARWDLDSWLSRELSSKVRPAGLDDALEYLAERPGLWGLLSEMFQRDPEERISSKRALKRFESIMANRRDDVLPEEGLDGAFFEDVLRAMDNCEIPYLAATDFVPPRPLHYVASFRRSLSLGLVLAEADTEVELEGDKLAKWKEATSNGNPGDVFVADMVENGQAEEIGVFEIGDKLLTVGDIPVAGGGFEKVVAMLSRQPKSSKYVKLQFDRVSVRTAPEEGSTDDDSATIDMTPAATIVDEGAWSSMGKRKANEDAFILHDINLETTDILLAGIFDGHGGKAASKSASQLMPALFTEELTSGRAAVTTSRQALELAWKTTCDTYQGGCEKLGEECVAEYNERDGIILAGTGSDDLIAGTTASLVSLVDNELTVLNCGDSRTLLINPAGKVVFETMDHSPEIEVDRIQRGIDQGFAYSLPECSLNKWWMTVGDYQYSVARSLEGPFATSKGIVCDADVTSLRPCAGGILLMASDGLWEVCGNEEIAKEVTKLRQQDGLEANTAAKRLCTRAIEKGSTDNVSVVVVYLE